MIFEPQTGIPVVSHQRMREDADNLKKLLAQKSISFSNTSILGQAIEAAERLTEWTKNPKLVPLGLKAPEVIRRIIGLSYLARSLFHARSNPQFDSLKRLLHHLAQDNPLPTEPLPGPSTARNFVFEMEVAALFMANGLHVKTASEPDVVIDGASGKWNFACKMVSSTESNSVGNNLAKGWEQVLRKEHPCHCGMVIMGLGQRLNHGDFLPVLDRDEDWWASFHNQEIPKVLLLQSIESMSAQIISQARTRIDDRDGRFRGVVVFAHTSSSFKATPMFLTATRILTRKDLFGSGFDGPEIDLIKNFNDAAQRVFME